MITKPIPSSSFTHIGTIFPSLTCSSLWPSDEFQQLNVIHSVQSPHITLLALFLSYVAGTDTILRSSLRDMCWRGQSEIMKESESVSHQLEANQEHHWRRRWHPTPVLLPGKSHGRRSLEGCSPWDRWGSDTTEWFPVYFLLSCIGEGNGNPLQCSCLENPRDGGAWWAAIYGVTQSQTQLKWLSSVSHYVPGFISPPCPTIMQVLGEFSRE